MSKQYMDICYVKLYIIFIIGVTLRAYGCGQSLYQRATSNFYLFCCVNRFTQLAQQDVSQLYLFCSSDPFGCAPQTKCHSGPE